MTNQNRWPGLLALHDQGAEGVALMDGQTCLARARLMSASATSGGVWILQAHAPAVLPNHREGWPSLMAVKGKQAALSVLERVAENEIARRQQARDEALKEAAQVSDQGAPGLSP